MPAGSNIPIAYHTLQNAGLISGQCRQYTIVAVELASSPATAPASRNCVGASDLTAQNTAGNVGTESNTMLNGHVRYV